VTQAYRARQMIWASLGVWPIGVGIFHVRSHYRQCRQYQQLRFRSACGAPDFGGVPRLLVHRDKLDSGNRDAVDGGVGVDDGPSDGHGEVVVELRRCQGAGGLGEEASREAGSEGEEAIRVDATRPLWEKGRSLWQSAS